MKILETVLNFLAVLARIIFPRKKNDAAGNCPCPDPLPAPPKPPFPADAGSGSNDDLHRSDSLALHQGHWGRSHTSSASAASAAAAAASRQTLNVMGCCLMISGAAGCLYKWFVV